MPVDPPVMNTVFMLVFAYIFVLTDIKGTKKNPEPQKNI